LPSVKKCDVSLLKNNYQYLQEDLAQQKNPSKTIPAERDHVWMGAVKKDVLLILYIMSITQVTSRGGIVSPGHIFNL